MEYDKIEKEIEVHHHLYFNYNTKSYVYQYHLRIITNNPVNEINLKFSVPEPHYMIGVVCAAENTGLIQIIQMLHVGEINLALLGDFNENIHSFIISGVPYWCNISVPM
jgi:hypothetical protein